MLKHRSIVACLMGVLLLAVPASAAPKVTTLGADSTTDADPVAACGALAASPYETGWGGRGLADDEVFLDGAQSACTAALAASPDSVEVKTWLARVDLLLGHPEAAAPLLEAAVAAGNPFATYLLSGLLGSGKGDSSDPERAPVLLQQAADAGFAPAEADLADRLENGTGVTQDYAEALRLYALAADNGHGHATYMVGLSYQAGLGTDLDADKAMTAYRHGVDIGGAEGWYGVGQLYELGLGVPQDYAKAAEAYEHGADAGEKMSETQLAYLLGQGLGVAKDDDRAFALLSDAVAQHYPQAQANIAINYLFGQGTPVDNAKALSNAIAASTHDIAAASGVVGYIYAEGLGVDRDLSSALSYFQSGAAAGDGFSSDRVTMTEAELACEDKAGSPYEPGGTGHGVDFADIVADDAISACENVVQRDPSSIGNGVWLARALMRAERYDEAVPLLKDGVDGANVLAETLMADMLLAGTGVDADPSQALALYQKAAAQEFGLAQLTLGTLYAEGKVVPADSTEALDWFKKASENGVVEAEGKIADLSVAPPPPSGDLAVGFGVEGPVY